MAVELVYQLGLRQSGLVQKLSCDRNPRPGRLRLLGQVVANALHLLRDFR